jgi:flagellar hook-associated protein 1
MGGLTSALSIAAGGLANVNAQIALVSQNVANINTPGYAVEIGTQQAVTAGGQGMGVHTGPAIRQINLALQASVNQQNATVTGLKTTQTALQTIDSVLGTPGQGNDIGSLLGAVSNQFSTLLTDPSSQTQQSAVVSAATTLANGINTLSSAYTVQRQAAQDDLGSSVQTLNSTLATIGKLSDAIVSLQVSGQSTADVENQRDAAVQSLSTMLDIKAIAQPNGDLSIFTTAGLSLPTRGTTNPFSIAGGNAQPGSYYPGGGLPGIMLGGTDVTTNMNGGQIGADLALRDQTLPTSQAELDEFASGLSDRFAAQGLTLFTDPAGNVPSGGGTPVQAGYVGYAGTIQVNPAVIATPSLIRDGNVTIAGSSTGASSFTPNPTGGPAGFTTLISRVLNFSFGAQVQSGVAQPAFNTTGLGASGKLMAPFTAAPSLSAYATDMVASQSQQSGVTTANLATETALQSSLTAKVTATSGVDMDTEMSMMITLENAYAANAKIMTAIQSMFSQLLQTVQ